MIRLGDDLIDTNDLKLELETLRAGCLCAKERVKAAATKDQHLQAIEGLFTILDNLEPLEKLEGLIKDWNSYDNGLMLIHNDYIEVFIRDTYFDMIRDLPYAITDSIDWDELIGIAMRDYESIVVNEDNTYWFEE